MRLSPFFWCLAASAACWLLLFASVPPSQQNFPLWDDFAFSQSAFLFAHGQGIHYLHWSSMPQLGQWLWALPFIWVCGDTHVALRLATITLGWVGLWAFYDVLCYEGISRAKAALAAATLGLNPYFFLLQGTFMNDVPALSLGLLALALYCRSLARRRLGTMLAALIAAGVAVSTRQTMLAVPIVAAVLVWRTPELRKRPLWLASVILPMALGLGVHEWFQQRSDVTRLTLGWPHLELLLILPFLAFQMLGVASLPVITLDRIFGPARRWLPALALMAGAAFYWWSFTLRVPYGGLFPYSRDAITPWGAYRSFTSGLPPVAMNLNMRWLLTIAGCVGGAALLMRLRPWVRRERPLGPLLLFGLLQLPLIVLALTRFYDRYLLVLLPTALYVAGAEFSDRKPAWARSLVVLGALGLLSVCLSHDLLSMTAARWRLGRRALVQRKISPTELEGGFNWDGWHSPQPRPPAVETRGYRHPFLVQWFPGISGRYALAYATYPGAVTLDTEPYSLWFPPQQARMYLLEQPPFKNGAFEPPGIAELEFHFTPDLRIEDPEDAVPLP